MHPGRLWAKRNAFAHWFGWVCPSCDGVIPCVWNVWSLLVLTVTWPLWYLPARIIRPHWLAFERQRIARAQNKPITPADEIPWIRLGVFGWGGLMWALFSAGVAVAALWVRQWRLLWAVPAMVPLWAGGGYLWGLIMKHSMSRRP